LDNYQHKKPKCVVTNLDVESYQSHYLNSASIMLIIPGQNHTLPEQNDLNCLVMLSLKKQNLDLSTFIVDNTNSDFEEEIFKNYNIIRKQNPQLFIIDTSRISVKHSKVDYKHEEINDEHFVEFIQEFKKGSYKQHPHTLDL